MMSSNRFSASVRALSACCVLSFSCVLNSSFAGEFTNFMGMSFVDIPSGSYEMGSCKMTEGMHKENRKRAFLGLPTVGPGCGAVDNQVNDNETPRHTVKIRSFKMAATPVTAGQYKKYLEAIGETRSADDWGLYNEEFRRLNSYGDDVPVVQVSWHEAQAFIRWLNKTKPANDPHVYRMPSESEWEYACRAGRNHRYCGSDDINEVGRVNRKDTDHQHDVRSKTANAWGLYGMSGSIWQWVEDVYHPSYVGAPEDGSAWTSLALDADTLMQSKMDAITNAVAKGKQSKIDAALEIERLRYDAESKRRHGTNNKMESIASRVLRGGSWRFSADFSRATYRLAGEPGNWYYGNGFRVAANLP